MVGGWVGGVVPTRYFFLHLGDEENNDSVVKAIILIGSIPFPGSLLGRLII